MGVATPRTQPYRQGGVNPMFGRMLGPALQAMLRGRPFFLPNPMDMERQAMQRRTGKPGSVSAAIADASARRSSFSPK